MTAKSRAEPFVEDVEDLYEHAPCGYLTTTSDETIVRVNAAIVKLTGFSAGELVGRKLPSLLTPGGRIYWDTHCGPLLFMQGTVQEIALEMHRKDSSPVPVLMNAFLKKDAGGTPIGIRATVFDASDRRQYERELLLARRRAENAAKTRADFLATLSHEIRTPLSAISSAARLLQTTELSPQQQRYLGFLNNSTENVLALLNAVLDFSKIEAGKMALDEQPFEVRPWLQGLCSSVEARALEKGVRLALTVDPDVPVRLVGDALKLGQVMNNLLSNAVKFTQAGEVHAQCNVAEASPETVRLHFAVRDTGIGIPADKLDGIFEEFAQSSAETQSRFGGTGLGLAISRRLVELHGGRLSVESKLGEGSTFSFSVRLRREPRS